jgi:hypothetical protein
MRLALLATLLSLVPFASSRAGVLLLAHDEGSQQLRIDDQGTRSAVSLSSNGIGVQAGSVAADAAANRVFFVVNAAASQTLYSLGYGSGGGVEQASLPATSRITHLEWDPSGSARLVGMAIDTTSESPALFEFRAGAITSLGMPSPDEFRFRTGVSAFRAGDDSLFLVGRQGAETQDRLFRFVLGPTPTVSSALLDPDLDLLELATAANGEVFGLAHSRLSGTTRLALVDATLAVTLRGAGTPDCCYVLAGSTAIDSTGPTLVALGSPHTDEVAGESRLWRFDLATGSVLDTVTAVSSVGLFHDTSGVLPGGDVFADGFESPGLPRR